MAADEQHGDPIQAAYWRANVRLITVLTVVWAVVSFVPLLFARELTLTIFGAPFSLWVAAQGAPIVYVLLVWIYERRMDRLDRRRRAGADG